MSKNVSLALLFLIGIGVAACNTVAGAGQDIENTGDAIQDEANEAR
ncbi:entericidin A/B family lipoprotein [Parvibaculum sp.]|jgi:predicted small secreted protein